MTSEESGQLGRKALPQGPADDTIDHCSSTGWSSLAAARESTCRRSGGRRSQQALSLQLQQLLKETEVGLYDGPQALNTC